MKSERIVALPTDQTAREDVGQHRHPPVILELEADAARRLIAANVTLAGYRLSRLMPEAIEDIVVQGRGSPGAIRALCRAALYLAYYDRAPRVTSEYVAKVVRLRDGDGAFAPREAADAQAASRVGAPSPVSVSTVRDSGMLLAVAAMIAAGAWMASAPDPAPSGAAVAAYGPPGAAIPTSERRVAAADGALDTKAGPARPPAPTDAISSTSPTSSPAAATAEPKLSAVVPDAVPPHARTNEGSTPRPSTPFLPWRQSLLRGETSIAPSPTIAVPHALPRLREAETSPRFVERQMPAIDFAQDTAPSAPSVPQIAELRGSMEQEVKTPSATDAKQVHGQAVENVVAYQGPILNLTMQRQGRVRIVIKKQGAAPAIIARFDASAGLLGSGELVGRISGDGHLAASGQLMMGANPFECDLTGVLDGDSMTGSASFVRTSGGRVYLSRFTLRRA